MSENRTNKSIKNIVFNFGNQIITLILSFVSRSVFIYTLGIEYLGINGLFSDVLGLLSMADLGFNTAMIYSFYKPLSDKDERKLSALIELYRKIYYIIASIIAIIGIAITPVIRVIVKTEKDIPLLEVYYVFALAGVVISYLFVYKTSIITADQKNYIITKITMITSIIKTIIQMISLLLFRNFILYLAVNLIFNFLNNIIASRMAVVLYPFIKQKEKLDNFEIKEIFANLKSVFIYKISSVLMTATDNIIISVICGTIIVGYYSNYLMITNKIVQLISLVFTSVTASIGNLVVKENASKRYEVFNIEQSVSFVICALVIPCFNNLVNDLISVWLGSEFIIGDYFSVAVSLNMYLACVCQPIWSYREATGLYTKTKWIMALAAILNIFFSIILGLLIGVKGIIFASIIARLLTYIWYEPKLLFSCFFDRSCLEYFIRIILNIFLIVINSIMLYFITSLIIVECWSDFIKKSIISFGIVLLITFIVYRKNEGFSFIIKKFTKSHMKI